MHFFFIFSKTVKFIHFSKFLYSFGKLKQKVSLQDNLEKGWKDKTFTDNLSLVQLYGSLCFKYLQTILMLEIHDFFVLQIWEKAQPAQP